MPPTNGEAVEKPVGLRAMKIAEADDITGFSSWRNRYSKAIDSVVTGYEKAAEAPATQPSIGSNEIPNFHGLNPAVMPRPAAFAPKSLTDHFINYFQSRLNPMSALKFQSLEPQAKYLHDANTPGTATNRAQ